MPEKQHTILICQGTGCISGGAVQIKEALEAECKRQKTPDGVEIKHTGCHGFCQRGPLVVIEPEGIFYTGVTSNDISDIIRSIQPGAAPVERLLYYDKTINRCIKSYHDVPFYYKQQRIVLRNCGVIDPENIDNALAVGAYQALRKALSMKPVEIIDEIKKSGLRGLGGAGFPTGRKWEAAFQAPGKVKYVICNGDEGDPGAFQDRSVLEGDPHSVLEGMIIAGYAIRANHGYAYVRNEYPFAVQRLGIAIKQAKERGFLGENILGSKFSFDVENFPGSGCFRLR